MRKYIIIALVIALVAGAAIFLSMRGEEDGANSPAQLLSLGERFLLELDYEQALVQFLRVIEIEPMNERAYLGAAETYIGMGDIDAAIAILEQGLAALPDSAEIINKLNEYGFAANPPNVSDETGKPNEDDNFQFITEISSDEINVTAESLTVKVIDNRSATIIISDIILKDSYMTNLSASGKNATEYRWGVIIYGDNGKYDVSTMTFAYEPGKNDVKAISDMQHSLWVGVESSFHNIGEVEMSYTSDSITWSFTVPDEYPFDFSTVSKYEVQIYNIYDNISTNRVYTPNS
ncbi:MAG: tetratricopeptide repeat protein [Oscillospiraceae bacterium]|nr:tetratricopeptide repeat protein [Oscillospiraceae bacterium]